VVSIVTKSYFGPCVVCVIVINRCLMLYQIHTTYKCTRLFHFITIISVHRRISNYCCIYSRSHLQCSVMVKPGAM